MIFSNNKLYKCWCLAYFMDNLSLKRGTNLDLEQEELDFGFLDDNEGFEGEVEIKRLKPKKPKLKFKFLVAS